MQTAIGLMTGSSMDGIDAVILRTDGESYAEHIAGESVSYGPEFHLLLRIAEYAVQREKGDLKLAEKHFNQHIHKYLQEKGLSEKLPSLNEELGQKLTLANVINKLTTLHGQLVQSLMNKAEVKDVDVIGFHGQNLYHNPVQKLTIQVGDGQLLANMTGIPTVNDFRSNDVLHGGQGAPLAPMYHRVLACRDKLYPVAVVNCGGIANISIIYGPQEEDVIGFDVGPGNALVDRYVRYKTDGREFMDLDGQYGKKGMVDRYVLALLQERAIVNYKDDFLKASPPKSLDARNFALIPELDSLSFEDACATLEAFTAKCIVGSIDLIEQAAPKVWVLAGGGWNNPVITGFLKQLLIDKIGLEVKVMTADEVGWNSKYIEVEIFAYLAVRSLKGLPISMPQITGVSRPMLGGRRYDPVAKLSNSGFRPAPE